MDLPVEDQAGIPRKWHVGPYSFDVDILSFEDIAVLSAHLKEAIPHPIRVAQETLAEHGDVFSKPRREELLLEAYRTAVNGGWPPVFDSMEGMRYYFYTKDGIVKLISHILSHHHPDWTPDKVRKELLRYIGPLSMKRLQELISIDAGQDETARLAQEAGIPAGQRRDGVIITTESGHDEDDEDPKVWSS